MFVRSYMTRNPITISPNANYPQAFGIIRRQKVRHLPVIENGNLIGILAEPDLLASQPAPATSLSVYELYSILENLRVRQLMTRPVVTVSEDCPVEEAARIMVERKISCLPIMDGNNLVGIITQQDIFNLLVDVLGGREEGFRMTVRVPDQAGQLSLIAGAIAKAGGNIVAVTSSKLMQNHQRELMIKESGADQKALSDWLQNSGFEVVELQAGAPYQPRMFG